MIVVDCAPTGETLRLLSFPDVARWWIDKVFPYEKQILAAARPLARSLLDIPLPSPAVFADIQRLSENLIAMNEILRDRRALHHPARHEPRQDGHRRGDADLHLSQPVRIPDRCGDRQPRSSPPGSATISRPGGRSRRSTWSSWTRRSRPFRSSARPTSSRRWSDTACSIGSPSALFAEHDPAAILHDSVTQQLEVDADGARLRLALPFAEKGAISLKKIGLELIVGVNGHKRTIMLPAAMAGYTPAAATFEDGALEVRFDG